MATIKQVAQQAGVGVGTVSRVLNDSGPVSSTTRERVLAVIDELDFTPSWAARNLATAQTLTVGVVLPFLTRPFFVSVLHGIESVVAETEYHLHIFNVETAEKRNQYFEALLFQGRLDGVIIVSLPLTDADAARLRAAPLATVLVETQHPAFSSVTVGGMAGAQRAVEHLLALGHRRIAYISGPAQMALGFRNNLDRRHGYEAMLQQHGIQPQPEYIRMEGDGRDAGTRMATQLLDLAEPPTAIFAASDDLAVGAMQAAQQRGMDVPGDLAVVGYDDIELAGYLGLTTVHQPMAEMGQRSVELLLRQLRGISTTLEQLVLPVDLIVRASTRMPE